MKSRRSFLMESGGGLGGIALTSMLAGEGQLHADEPQTHHPARAKRVVQFFMAGAASHIDLFDYKPDLIQLDGKPSDFG